MKKNKYIIGFVLLLCVLFAGGWSGFMQSHGIKQTGSDRYENFTGYTETDGPGKVTVTANTITLTNGDRDEDYYVTKDFGASYFGNFTHWVDVNVTALTNDGNSSLWAWAISNADDDIDDIDIAGGDAISVIASHFTSTKYRVQLYSLDSGTPVIVDSSASIAVGTKTYWAISRTGTTGTVEIYSTDSLRRAGGAGDIDTISGTVVGTAFRYVYGIASRNNGLTGKDISGTVSNLVFDFELVTNGGFAAVSDGADIITDGDMSNPGSWTIGANWGIAGGVATCDGLGESSLSQNFGGASRLGKTFKLTITLSNVAGAGGSIYVGGTLFIADVGALGNGTHVYYETIDSTAILIGFNSDGGGSTYDVTDVAVEEITFTNWTAGTGWAPGASAGALTGKANKVAGTASAIEQDVSAVASVGFEIVWTNDQSTSGKSINAEIGAVNGTAVTSDATTTDEITASTTRNLKFEAADDWAGTIDNVSVKRIFY